jgi:hypothetical protein
MSEPPPSWGGYLPAAAAIESRPNGKVTWLGEIAMKEVEWVERPLLQASTFHLLGGRPATGKGALCARWVARCTSGEMYGSPRLAMWLASEDDPAIDLGPRIEAAGGNRMRVALIPETLQLPRDIGWMRETARRLANVGLIVIDPLSGHIRADGNDDDEVRRALLPLGLLAGELEIPIVGIRHVSSKESRAGLLARILGSTAWVGVPRVVLGAAQDRQGNVHVQPIKGNRVQKQQSGRRFKLFGKKLPNFQETVVSVVDEGESQIDVDAVLIGEEVAVGHEQIEKAVLELLSEEIEMDDTIVDATIAERLEVGASEVRSARQALYNRAWLRNRSSGGTWYVSLTAAAPRNVGPPVDEPPEMQPPNRQGSGAQEIASGVGTGSGGGSPTDERTLDEAWQDTTFVDELAADGIVDLERSSL